MTFAAFDRARMIIRYITATINHVWKDLNVLATTFFAELTSSGNPITERIDVSFSVMMN